MKRILTAIVAIIVGFCFVVAPAYAADDENKDEKCVKTAIIGGGEVCDDGKGSSIIDVLRIVVNIMSAGVAILGVVGITVVGIQYLTAGGNEEKTRTAKRRILEIVIGLAVYAVAYMLLYWLLPGFSGTLT